MTGEQRPQRVGQETLNQVPRPEQRVVAPLVHLTPDKGSLIDRIAGLRHHSKHPLSGPTFGSRQLGTAGAAGRR